MPSGDIELQLQTYRRGAVDLISENELRSKLERSAATGKPLVIKAGFDPTAPDLHLGHTIVMNKMRQFQEFGHEVVFVVGDFTAMIGDPSGKNATRPPLTKEQVLKGAETYKVQAFRILDAKKTRVEYNSSWLEKLGAEGLIKLQSRYTLARMLEREDFKNRFQSQTPISIHEFVYPLLQAYDSVALNADVELGGSDQLFNLVIGRSIQKEYGQEPQIVITTPLLEGTDAKVVGGVLTGNKMSKSLGNYIGITEEPGEIFKKIQFIDDTLMWRYYLLMSGLPLRRIEELKAGDPREAKKLLGAELAARFHGEEAAARARAWFEATFEGRGFPEDAKVVRFALEAEPGIWIAKALKEAGIARSNGEAVRLIQQDAVTINGSKIRDKDLKLSAGEYRVKVGKDRFVKIVVD